MIEEGELSDTQARPSAAGVLVILGAMLVIALLILITIIRRFF